MANDFEIAENLAIQPRAHPKKMADGVIVLIDIGHFLKLLNGTRRIVAQQLYELKGVLGKTIELRAVTGRGRQQSVDALRLRLHQQLFTGGLAETELATGLGIGFLVA